MRKSEFEQNLIELKTFRDLKFKFNTMNSQGSIAK